MIECLEALVYKYSTIKYITTGEEVGGGSFYVKNNFIRLDKKWQMIPRSLPSPNFSVLPFK